MFTVTSSNPDIAASVATGPFWTLTLSHMAALGQAGDIPFTGSIVFQLFNDLTPITVSKFQTFVNDNYYIGKDITRIVKDFSGGTAGDYVIQGGAPNPDGSGNSGEPGTPYGVELLQQLAFTGPGTLAVANTGQPNSNDTQFFIDTAAEPFLNYGYTLFGEVVAGQNILNDLKSVATQFNSFGEKSAPISPVTITASTFTTTNPNGVVHIDTTQARPGETSTITVTATDSVDKTKTSRTFVVTVGAYSGPKDPPINFRPLASPVAAAAAVNTARTVTLTGASGYPDSAFPATLQYGLVSQPAHGTITNFNATTGTLTYTPNAGYLGTDSFQYMVTSQGPLGAPATLASNAAMVTLTITKPESDYTGVNHSQLAVFRPSTAEWFVLGPNGGQALGAFGAIKLTDVPVPGDYLGVGQTELAVFRPSTDEWFVKGANGGKPFGIFGGPGDIPVPGDYDHVGHTELAVFRPSTGQWFVKDPVTGKGRQIINPNSPTGAFGAINLTDIPVPGDYDGIGYTEMAVFRPATAQWFVFNPITGKGHQLVVANSQTGAFGATNLSDIPVPGDYDSVGYTEMAVFRPSTGQWFVYNPVTKKAHQFSNPNVVGGAFGALNLVDIPAAGPAGSLVRLGRL
jgi:cyclophilin family peptidyl-prolyl cis-trans isomerase/allophanate hydrolase subunit 1